MTTVKIKGLVKGKNDEFYDLVTVISLNDNEIKERIAARKSSLKDNLSLLTNVREIVKNEKKLFAEMKKKEKISLKIKGNVRKIKHRKNEHERKCYQDYEKYSTINAFHEEENKNCEYINDIIHYLKDIKAVKFHGKIRKIKKKTPSSLSSQVNINTFQWAEKKESTEDANRIHEELLAYNVGKKKQRNYNICVDAKSSSIPLCIKNRKIQKNGKTKRKLKRESEYVEEGHQVDRLLSEKKLVKKYLQMKSSAKMYKIKGPKKQCEQKAHIVMRGEPHISNEKTGESERNSVIYNLKENKSMTISGNSRQALQVRLNYEKNKLYFNGLFKHMRKRNRSTLRNGTETIYKENFFSMPLPKKGSYYVDLCETVKNVSIGDAHELDMNKYILKEKIKNEYKKKKQSSVYSNEFHLDKKEGYIFKRNSQRQTYNETFLSVSDADDIEYFSEKKEKKEKNAKKYRDYFDLFLKSHNWDHHGMSNDNEITMKGINKNIFTKSKHESASIEFSESRLLSSKGEKYSSLKSKTDVGSSVHKGVASNGVASNGATSNGATSWWVPSNGQNRELASALKMPILSKEKKAPACADGEDNLLKCVDSQGIISKTDEKSDEHDDIDERSEHPDITVRGDVSKADTGVPNPNGKFSADKDTPNLNEKVLTREGIAKRVNDVNQKNSLKCPKKPMLDHIMKTSCNKFFPENMTKMTEKKANIMSLSKFVSPLKKEKENIMKHKNTKAKGENANSIELGQNKKEQNVSILGEEIAKCREINVKSKNLPNSKGETKGENKGTLKEDISFGGRKNGFSLEKSLGIKSSLLPKKDDTKEKMYVDTYVNSSSSTHESPNKNACEDKRGDNTTSVENISPPKFKAKGLFMKKQNDVKAKDRGGSSVGALIKCKTENDAKTPVEKQKEQGDATQIAYSIRKRDEVAPNGLNPMDRQALTQVGEVPPKGPHLLEGGKEVDEEKKDGGNEVKRDEKNDGEKDEKNDGEKDEKNDGEKDEKNDGEKDEKNDGEKDGGNEVKRDGKNEVKRDGKNETSEEMSTGASNGAKQEDVKETSKEIHKEIPDSTPQKESQNAVKQLGKSLSKHEFGKAKNEKKECNKMESKLSSKTGDEEEGGGNMNSSDINVGCTNNERGLKGEAPPPDELKKEERSDSRERNDNTNVSKCKSISSSKSVFPPTANKLVLKRELHMKKGSSSSGSSGSGSGNMEIPRTTIDFKKTEEGEKKNVNNDINKNEDALENKDTQNSLTKKVTPKVGLLKMVGNSKVQSKNTLTKKSMLGELTEKKTSHSKELHDEKLEKKGEGSTSNDIPRTQVGKETTDGEEKKDTEAKVRDKVPCKSSPGMVKSLRDAKKQKMKEATQKLENNLNDRGFIENAVRKNIKKILVKSENTSISDTESNDDKKFSFKLFSMGRNECSSSIPSLRDVNNCEDEMEYINTEKKDSTKKKPLIDNMFERRTNSNTGDTSVVVKKNLNSGVTRGIDEKGEIQRGSSSESVHIMEKDGDIENEMGNSLNYRNGSCGAEPNREPPEGERDMNVKISKMGRKTEEEQGNILDTSKLLNSVEIKSKQGNSKVPRKILTVKKSPSKYPIERLESNDDNGREQTEEVDTKVKGDEKKEEATSTSQKGRINHLKQMQNSRVKTAQSVIGEGGKQDDIANEEASEKGETTEKVVEEEVMKEETAAEQESRQSGNNPPANKMNIMKTPVKPKMNSIKGSLEKTYAKKNNFIKKLENIKSVAMSKEFPVKKAICTRQDDIGSKAAVVAESRAGENENCSDRKGDIVPSAQERDGTSNGSVGGDNGGAATEASPARDSPGSENANGRNDSVGSNTLDTPILENTNELQVEKLPEKKAVAKVKIVPKMPLKMEGNHLGGKSFKGINNDTKKMAKIKPPFFNKSKTKCA
ncbi:hypothetical protein POVWA1_014180 [Plasmodium ovale wallikeri]|uniref:Uncharacterized protein n=1 Tax=Plasmodium ovale wallikeri TaxID=864142 RepID=A0A1A8YMP1_PLAOA|nr:hypothetical protein POVWA1_014180 [Plasmodium ovale wallikeri]